MQTINIKGEPFILMSKVEYDRLQAKPLKSKLPPMPKPAKDGSVPAPEFFRASIAREIITRRSALGWTQRDLAEAAGVRVETVCRLETAKHSASNNTVAKLDQALRNAEPAPRDGKKRRG